jgi:pilus assembly protein FimV
MRWKTAIFLASALGAPSASVSALGLGDIQLQSSLNEPFRARINLVGASRDELDSLRVSLAGMTEFKRAGVDRAYHLSKLRFQLVQPASGADYIQVTSHEPIREPFVDFLVELNWAKGRVVREFAVLLDPPNRRAPSTRMTRRSRDEAPAAPYEPADESPIVAAAGRGEAAGDAEGASRRGAVGGGGAGTYGPTRASDTLWAIAKRVRPDSSVSVPQAMMALLRSNPNAFIRNNINNLKRGRVLRIPSRGAMESISRAQAWAEVKQHNALWDNYRQGIASDAVPVQPETSAEAAPPPSPGEAASPAASGQDARLRVLGADAKSPATGGATGEQASTGEELAAQKQQNADIQKRVKDAEVLIEQLQRLVKLKDDQLAAMQGKAATPGAETAMPPAPTAGEATVPASPGAAAPGAPATPATGTEPAAPTPTSPPAAGPTPEAPKPPEAAAPPAKAPSPPPKPPAAPEPAPEAMGFMDKVRLLVPESVAESVPGGALTVLFGSLALLLGLVLGLMRLFGRRGAAADEDIYLDELTGALPEPAGQAGRTSGMVLDEEETAELAAQAYAEAPTMQGDVTITQELPVTTTQPFEVRASDTMTRAAMAAAQDSDPLETVNVYLAYERFEQAEELVKKALERDPNNPKYLSRLLEVYYAAENINAYEQTAYRLRDIVGGQGGVWDSAVAMWYAMSPGRGLFEHGDPGVLDMSTALTRRTKSIVDVTSGESLETSVDLSDTVTSVPGGTQAPAAWDATTAITDDDLDFNIVGRTDDEDDSILDLTGAGSRGPLEMFDLSTGDLTETSMRRGAPAASKSASEPDEFERSGILDLTDTGAGASFDLERSDNLFDLTVSRGSKGGPADWAADKTSPMAERPDDITYALSDSTVRLPGSDEQGFGGDATDTSRDWEATGDTQMFKPGPGGDVGPLDFDLGLTEEPEDENQVRERLSSTVDRMELEDLSKAADSPDFSLVLTDPTLSSNPMEAAKAEIDAKLNRAKSYLDLGDVVNAESVLKELPEDLNEEQSKLAQELRDQLKA